MSVGSMLEQILECLKKRRSRRKGADLTSPKDVCVSVRPTANGGDGTNGTLTSNYLAASTSSISNSGNKKTGVVSFSGSTKLTRKPTKSMDSCVADSIDDQTLEKICCLPNRMDKNEWMATHTLALFDHVNSLCGTLNEMCTPVTCSIMSFPGNPNFRWLDEKGKRHNYSAMRYIDSVMTYCDSSRKEQSIFPTKYGATFPNDFHSHCSRMVRLLWHCCGHLYSKHWDQLGALNLRPQYNLVLAHLHKISKLYGLLDSKELSSLTNTLQLVRPPLPSSPQAHISQTNNASTTGTVVSLPLTTTPNTTTIIENANHSSSVTATNNNSSSFLVQQNNQQQQKLSRPSKRTASQQQQQEDGDDGGRGLSFPLIAHSSPLHNNNNAKNNISSSSLNSASVADRQEQQQKSKLHNTTVNNKDKNNSNVDNGSTNYCSNNMATSSVAMIRTVGEQQKWDQQTSSPPPMKSGSWGGRSIEMAIVSQSPIVGELQQKITAAKTFVQTC